MQQVRLIRGGPDVNHEPADFWLRYDGGWVRLAPSEFRGLLLDLIEFNPAIKVKVHEGWGRGR